MSKWEDLTDAQKKRLLAASQRESSYDDPVWYELRNLGLVGAVGTDEGRYIDYLTPAGGALLAERDAMLIDFVRRYIVIMQGGRILEKDLWELTKTAKEVYALAAVAKERGE